MEFSKPIPARLVLEMPEPLREALHKLTSEPGYPTIDAEALMSGLFGQLTSYDESFAFESRADEVQFLLQETLGNVGKLPDQLKAEIAKDTTAVVDGVWKMLETNGVFIDGQQPYEFDKFFFAGTSVVLRKAEILNH